MGILVSMINQARPPKSGFGVEDIPDLTGKVVIVTGGNTGIGYHTVKALLQHNAKVYLFARSKDKAVSAIAKLKEETGKEAIFLQCDLASIKSVKAAAEEFKSKERDLHVLFNSGGVMFPPIDQITTDGYDLQFGTNVLGHAILTIQLLPALIAGGESSPDGKARVVNTSSFAAYLADGKIDFRGSKDLKVRKKLGRTGLYNQSKLGNAIFSNELARRYGSQGIVSTALNPGNLRTELQRNLTSWQDWLLSPMLYPAPMGALTQLWAGTSPDAAEYNGKWLIPWARLQPKQPKAAEDTKLGKELWDWIEEQSKLVE